MNCAIYIRVSTEKQQEKYSLSVQRQILTDYAKSREWAFIVYDEGSGSGETLENRPQMVSLLQDAKAGKFDVCLVVELERLSRDEDLFDWLTIKKTFRDSKIKMATPNQFYDLEDDEDDFLSDLFGALAKREKKKLLKRTKRGALEAVKQGTYIGSHFRIGHRYDKDLKTLVIVPEEADVVRLIFKLSNEDNMGLVKITEYLNSKRIPTALEFAEKKGVFKAAAGKLKIGQWTNGVVWRILTNPIYYGDYRFNRVEQRLKRNVRKRPESEWVRMKVEPIITYDDFQKAQANLKNRSKWSNRNTKNDYLLSGLVHCGECESRMQGATFKAYEKRDETGKIISKRWKTDVYYICYGRRHKSCAMPYADAQKIDKAVWLVVKKFIEQPQRVFDETIRISQKELQGQKQTIPGKLKELEKGFDKLNKAQDRLLDAYSMGDIDRADLKKQMPKLKLRKSQMSGELELLRLQLGKSDGRELKLSNLAHIKTGINTSNKYNKKDVLRNAIDKVILYRDGSIDIITLLDIPNEGQKEPYVLDFVGAGPGSPIYHGIGEAKDGSRRFTIRVPADTQSQDTRKHGIGGGLKTKSIKKS